MHLHALTGSVHWPLARVSPHPSPSTTQRRGGLHIPARASHALSVTLLACSLAQTTGSSLHEFERVPLSTRKLDSRLLSTGTFVVGRGKHEYSMIFASPLQKSGEYSKVFCLSSGLLGPFGPHQARARGSSCRLLRRSGLAQASGTPMRMLAIARTTLQTTRASRSQLSQVPRPIGAS